MRCFIKNHSAFFILNLFKMFTSYFLLTDKKPSKVNLPVGIPDIASAVEMAKNLVEKGMSINNAAKEIAAQTPFKKGDIYKALI